MAVAEQQPKSCSVNDTSSVNETHESSTAEVSSENAQRILVAEDSPVTQDLLKLVLEERGHYVEVVADGEAALGWLNSAIRFQGNLGTDWKCLCFSQIMIKP